MQSDKKSVMMLIIVCADGHKLSQMSVIMLSDAMQSVIMLSVIMLSVVMLTVIMLNVIMLSVIMVNVVVLKVVAANYGFDKLTGDALKVQVSMLAPAALLGRLLI